LRPCLLERLETNDHCIHCAPELLLADLPRLAAEMATPPAAGLRLIGRRDPRNNNSWMHNAPRLIKGKPRHQLLMHPGDLAARGIADGARVSVHAARGRIEVEVQASDSVMPGVACLPHGYGHARDGTRQRLAESVAGPSYNDLGDPAALDAPSGNAALNGLPITVAPLAHPQRSPD